MTLEIALDVDEEWDSSGSWENLVRLAAEAALDESDYALLRTSKRRAEVSVTLTSDDEVRALNKQWRAKDKPTNVLSFPMVTPDELLHATVGNGQLLLGDIILAHGVCELEAGQKGVTVEDHAAHLVVHGTLHLLGYDHQDDREAGDMEEREIRALARLHISNPYEVAA